jgi:catechol 2,3-dioxygenase-like lactoylglutathione lyase family enzyme
MRLQLALNVSDLDEAVAYYSRFFGVQPHKQRPGYANFAIDEPPLKLVLFENSAAAEHLNHLGVEVFDKWSLDKAVERLESNGLAKSARLTGVCCHAEQDKIWSAGPDGERWEWYQIVDDIPERSSCC